MRISNITRKTKETDITISLNLDGGRIEINTGVGFFDHMLNSFAFHGDFGLSVSVSGDLNVDAHHTVEDTGIVLGQAFGEALGDKSGIVRFGSFSVPMDEALTFACVDISGRPFIYYDVPVKEQKIGEYDTALSLEFWRAFAFAAGITLHIELKHGSNAHHIIEACFKAAGKALRQAVTQSGEGVPSTKGAL